MVSITFPSNQHFDASIRDVSLGCGCSCSYPKAVCIVVLAVQGRMDPEFSKAEKVYRVKPSLSSVINNGPGVCPWAAK